VSDSAARHSQAMSVEAFLAFCESLPQTQRWELIEGVPVMMTGGTAAHSLIISNLVGVLDPPARRRGCRAMTSFLAWISDRNAFEPDVTVQCGPVAAQSQYTTDPVVVIEVLSRSSMRRDRVLKFEGYRQVASVQQIVLVYQDSLRIESWLRENDDWGEPVVLTRPEDRLAVPVLGASVAIPDIYEGVAPSPLNEL
jgi:Uma2 family endonuclease